MLVNRAHDIELECPVAVKVLAPERTHDPDYRRRFKREARLAAGLQHPNVVPVHATGEVPEQGLMFLVMQFVPGQDLGALIREQGRLAPRRAVSVLAQVAAALDAAHQTGLVHRDVKPANILITGSRSQHVYLTDFGLTKALTSDEPVMTRVGELVGTPDYIAPEQVKGEQVDGRADIYSLGCVLYEVLTGQIPFPRDTEMAKYYAHVSDPPPSMLELVPDIELGLDEVVQRAVAKDPAERFQTAGEMAAAALDAAGVPRRDTDGATPAPSPAGRASRRRRTPRDRGSASGARDRRVGRGRPRPDGSRRARCGAHGRAGLRERGAADTAAGAPGAAA